MIIDGKAVYSIDPLIEYCPLASDIFTRDKCGKCLPLKERILEEVNEQAIGEYKMFSPERHLKECESAVLFGSSEMTMDAMKKGLVDCSVQVCDGIGTVIARSPEAVQGIGAVMTGTFYTSPIRKLIEKCYEKDIFPVFPETADIDQKRGVNFAVRLGHKNIVVTTAAYDNIKLPEISRLEEKNNLNIIRLALCATGIDEYTAEVMRDYSDISWTCASRYARDIISKKALLQIGLKIPVYVMTKRGLEFVKPRLLNIDPEIEDRLDSIYKQNKQKEKQVIFHDKWGGLGIMPISEIDWERMDSPRPLI